MQIKNKNKWINAFDLYIYRYDWVNKTSKLQNNKK